MINFKTLELRQQWNSGKLNPRLQVIVMAVAEKIALDYNCVLFITSLFRPGDKGVHVYWRGIDIRTRNLLPGEAQNLTDWINNNFIYDMDRTNMKTAILHTIGKKAQLHIHLQTCYGKSDSWS